MLCWYHIRPGKRVGETRKDNLVVSIYEEEYTVCFPFGTGQPACRFQMALGTLLAKELYQFSDEENVAHITTNPYLQYFIGLSAFT